jgi:hypothetical protein
VRQEAKREKKHKEERQGRDKFEDNHVIYIITTGDTAALNNAYPGPDNTSYNNKTESEEETMPGEPQVLIRFPSLTTFNLSP